MLPSIWRYGPHKGSAWYAVLQVSCSFAILMHAALQHCSTPVLSAGFARNTEFSVVILSANSVTMSLSPSQEQRQGDFPEHTLFIKVPTVT